MQTNLAIQGVERLQSVIKYFRDNKLPCYANSSEVYGGYSADNAFKEDAWFESQSPKAWWSAYFSKPIIIKSYNLGAKTSWTWRPTKWKISYSQDGVDFIDIQTDVFREDYSNSHYPLKTAVFCQYFRVDGIEDSYIYNGGLAIKNFDVQGYVIHHLKETCDHSYYNKRISRSALFLSFFISSN